MEKMMGKAGFISYDHHMGKETTLEDIEIENHAS